MMQTCVHKTYPTKEKAISKWYSLGKARRDKFTVYKCPKCLRWRVTSYAVLDAMPTAAQVVREKRQERAARVRKAQRKQKHDSQLNIIKRQCSFCYKYPDHWRECPAYLATGKRCRLKEPKASVTLKPIAGALASEAKTLEENRAEMATKDARKRKFAPRPKRAALALAKATMSQLKPEWAITAEQREGLQLLYTLAQAGDKPILGQRILAAGQLGPFDKLPYWVQRDILNTGVSLPRTKHGRIPLGEALTWEKKGSRKAQAKATKRKSKRKSPYPLGMSFQKYITAAPTIKPVTFCDDLERYAVGRYGVTHGPDYAQSTAAWVLAYARRDLRRSGMHFGLDGVTDKRKPHRVRTATGKPNRWRKFSTRSLKHYWAWLVSLLKTCAAHQSSPPENWVVLPYDDNREVNDGTRRTRKTPTKAYIEN